MIILKGVFGTFSRAFTFLSSGKLLSDILALTVVGLLVLGIYMKGRTDSNIACAKRQTAGIERSIKTYSAIKHKIITMPQSNLDRELSKWMRD